MEENELKEFTTLINRMGETETNFALLFDIERGYLAGHFFNDVDNEIYYVDKEYDEKWVATPSQALKNFYFTNVSPCFTEEIQLDISKNQYDKLLEIASQKGMLVDELISELLSDAIPK